MVTYNKKLSDKSFNSSYLVNAIRDSQYFNELSLHKLTILFKEVKQLFYQLYTNIPLGGKKFPQNYVSKITNQICNLQHP